MIPAWVNKYLSIDYEKLDCWNLVRKVYADEFGIEVGGIGKQRTHMRKGEWIDIFDDGLGFEVGDVLLFKSTPLNRHVGLIISTNLMLHTIRGANSCVERWESSKWRSRMVGIYRHKKRCSQP